MKTLVNICVAFMLSVLSVSCGNAFTFSPNTVISVENDEQEVVAEWFAWLFARPGGFVPQVAKGASGADVLLRSDMSMDNTAYRIKVGRRRMCIEASSPLGFFYAFQYIRQQLPEDINARRHADRIDWTVPAMSVQDAHSTGCEGLVLDLCCRLLPKDNVLHLIEAMPSMGVYDLIIVNDECYTHEELDEMLQYAAGHKVKVISEYMMSCASPAGDSYELVWQDDFSGIDDRYWSRISREDADWRKYMSDSDSLYGLEDGCLVLRATVNDGTAPRDTASFLTGGLYTKGKFTLGYGKVEVRAKLPSARSVWPAIWMMPHSGTWPDAGEIDIMEHLNHDMFVYQTVHSRYATTLSIKDPKSSVKVPVKPEKYNIYGVEIMPDSLVFRVNGRRTMMYPRLISGEYAGPVQYPFGTPYYILMDMQIGGAWVGPATGEDLPAEMKVDWIKVYRLKAKPNSGVLQK